MDFKDRFGRNYELASKKFQTAIDEINKSIDHLQKIKENIYDVAKSLLEKQKETVYFDLTNDSSECLRTNGTYFKVFNLTLINDTLILGGAVENDTPEVCPADDVFIEDFCGLLMAHCSDLKP